MEVYWFTVVCACDRVGCIIYSISYQANGKLCTCMVGCQACVSCESTLRDTESSWLGQTFFMGVHYSVYGQREDENIKPKSVIVKYIFTAFLWWAMTVKIKSAKMVYISTKKYCYS